MSSHRPKNLNLFTIHFPLPAIVSILHRITGVALFFFMPFFLWVLAYSLTYEGFYTLQAWLQTPLIKLFIWLILIPLCFHLVAGIRHLLLDMHIGERLATGRKSAVLTFIFAFCLIILVGIWLW